MTLYSNYRIQINYNIKYLNSIITFLTTYNVKKNISKYIYSVYLIVEVMFE